MPFVFILSYSQAAKYSLRIESVFNPNSENITVVVSYYQMVNFMLTGF